MKSCKIWAILISVIIALSIISLPSSVYAATNTNATNSPASVAKHSEYFFPKNEVSISFYDKDFFTFNVPRPPSPIFWHASTEADAGAMGAFEHVIFHTKKWFSINAGLSFAHWSMPNDGIEALSAFLAFKLWVPISPCFRPYVYYSVAGPTMLSQKTFGHANFAENFVFQDLLGVGVQMGRHHAADIALLLVHYSNGDIFYKNSGIDVPVILKLGIVLP